VKPRPGEFARFASFQLGATFLVVALAIWLAAP